jgi:hypothetical protein
MLLLTLAVAAAFQAEPAAAASAPLPDWVAKLIAAQPFGSRTVVEEATYMGKPVFEVLPGDRSPDSGNEHVLHAEDGRVICEFGGFAGHVTSGSCNIGKINFVRTLYPGRSR